MADTDEFDFDVGDDPTDPDVLEYWASVAARIRLALLPHDLEGWADAIESRISEFRKTQATLAAATERLNQVEKTSTSHFAASLADYVALHKRLQKIRGKSLKTLFKAICGRAPETALEEEDRAERSRLFAEFAARLATEEVPEDVKELAQRLAVSIALAAAHEAQLDAATAECSKAKRDYDLAVFEFPRLKWKLPSHFGRHYKLDSPAIKALFARRSRGAMN